MTTMGTLERIKSVSRPDSTNTEGREEGRGVSGSLTV